MRNNFDYVDFLDVPPAMGKAYFIGDNENNTLKIDIFYTDTFIQPYIEVDGIRMATIEEIIAMKVDVIQRGGRKKDFWDLHALFENYRLDQMLQLHERRYPYSHEKENILQNFVFFQNADDDFDPICLKGKYWEFIKDDLKILIENYKK